MVYQHLVKSRREIIIIIMNLIKIIITLIIIIIREAMEIVKDGQAEEIGEAGATIITIMVEIILTQTLIIKTLITKISIIKIKILITVTISIRDDPLIIIKTKIRAKILMIIAIINLIIQIIPRVKALMVITTNLIILIIPKINHHKIITIIIIEQIEAEEGQEIKIKELTR